MRDYKRWTRKEVFDLYGLCTRYSPKVIAKRLGRSVPAVRYKLRSLSIRARADVYSQRAAELATGYHYYQLQRAKRALDQKWGMEIFKTPRSERRPKKRAIITENQLEALCEYLKTDPLKYQRAA